MQNYLREQPDNIKTINLISEVCMFLQSFYVEVTKDNIALIKRILQTLIEMSVVSNHFATTDGYSLNCVHRAILPTRKFCLTTK